MISTANDKLRLTEIFFSIQGESGTTGIPTVFVRLTGCPLRCQYCDTSYAFQGGRWYLIAEIIQNLAAYQTRYVTVTGGEPLAQKGCIKLLKLLCDAGYYVTLETSGALSIANVDSRVIKILDIKTPGSAEVDSNLLSNLNYLQPHDEIKFVICDEADYIFAKKFIADHQLLERCPILFSPSHDQLSAQKLAKWILADQLPVRLQVQLHKYLGLE